MNKMIGRADRLEVKKAVDHWKAKGLDFSKILYQPEVPTGVGRFCQIPQDHGLDKALDNTVLRKLCAPAIERKEKVAGRPADPQRQPRRRHDRRQRNHPALGRRRACPRTRSSSTSPAPPGRASARSCPRA